MDRAIVPGTDHPRSKDGLRREIADVVGFDYGHRVDAEGIAEYNRVFEKGELVAIVNHLRRSQDERPQATDPGLSRQELLEEIAERCRIAIPDKRQLRQHELTALYQEVVTS